MKVQTKKINGTKVELDIEVPQEIVKKKFDQVYEQIGKEAKIPVFRPGKEPRDILEKHHSRLAQEEVIKNLIPEVYADSIEKEKFRVVDLPQISDVKLQSNILSFKASVEVLPEIEVKDYRNIKLDLKKTAVAPEEVDNVLDELKASHNGNQIDEKFARGLGYRTVDEMRSSIQRQLWQEKERAARYNLQDSLVQQIVGRVKCAVPQSLVNKRLQELVRQAKAQMLMRGSTKEEAEVKDPEMRKQLLQDAQLQVKSFLVLQEIARKENIPQEDNVSEKVIQFLLSEADWGGVEIDREVKQG